ncbi:MULTISPECIES: carboxymuconolactone decarboxylase family protein [Bacillaceae]|uniref:Carboxymuconolactone decarboxylase family protein n=1 Tax=Cytobacillus stercorigallinarum TaxID=2762240 RepID=A0ABR8QQ11_9BACI|nr:MULTISPECIES: carboxymuconolactone decarboxylase family protein [Bacillaceae]MBD7937631.1 carboxymuconolactone decarboxylase family protein [Cytobacillus stercorigallinarum]MCM3324744.1 carboxymuconolactone decarboxylase family protein [Cytobacillus kochii]MCM3347137.1 carboxymuconolactone decarboxylase family protein [Cytobacillus kochii]MDQ0186684.1 alkylhydroperoxidase family enzyme [Cytobacillus kochii]MED5100745.1 carboxymuconolactone decarboxylase family protein [Niallia circulans]
MARIVGSNFGETHFQRLLGHNKEVMEGWNQLGNVLEKDGLLTSELKEQVRRTLAQSNGCEYCKAKGKPDPDKFNEKTSIAVGFAEVFLKQKGDIADSSFDILKEYFTEEEISELCAFISFTTASQYFGAMMKLEPLN